jgi:hypothetical protein
VQAHLRFAGLLAQPVQKNLPGQQAVHAYGKIKHVAVGDGPAEPLIAGFQRIHRGRRVFNFMYVRQAQRNRAQAQVGAVVQSHKPPLAEMKTGREYPLHYI